MESNNDLASLHAYLCADGYVIKNPPMQRKKYYRIGLRNTNAILLRDFQLKFFNTFNIEPHIREGRCELGSKEIYLFLTKEYNFYSRGWVVPNIQKEFMSAWLRSFFDCEGWVLVRVAVDRHIGADSVNKCGLFRIKEILENEFEISSKFRETNRGGIFRLLIYGKENLIKLQKEIGFLHPDKRKKLIRAIDSYVLK